MRNAAIVTTASGNEVAAATNSVPTKVWCQPMASASALPTNGSQMPATMRPRRHNARRLAAG